MAGILGECVECLLNLINNSEQLADTKDVFKNISNYFQEEHTRAELDLALSILLNEHDSLIYFIKRAVTQSQLKNVVEEAFEVVQNVISQHIDKMSQYFLTLNDVCMSCVLLENTSAGCKDMAYQIVIALIENKNLFSPDADLNGQRLMNIVKRELSITKKVATVQKRLYQLCGVLAEHYPLTVSIYSQKLMKELIYELEQQTHYTNNVQMQVITGCLLGLTGMLVNFTQDYQENPENCKKIYKCVKKIIENDEVRQRVAHRAALGLLSKHMQQFWALVYSDYAWWLTTLQRWTLKTGDDRKAGLVALETFYVDISNHLASSDTDKDREVLWYFIRHYTDIFKSSTAPQHGVTLAIKGFGKLSRACQRLMTQEDVVFMFTLILQRVQQNILKSEADTNKNVNNLSDYVEALSDISRELDVLTEEHLLPLKQLCILTVEHYPQVSSNFQYTVVNAVMVTIFNISLAPGDHIAHFLEDIVYQIVVRMCGHSLIQDAELQKEIENKKNVVTYKNYLSFWKDLFSIQSSLKVNRPGVTSAIRQSLLIQLYDALIITLMKLIRRLDLSTKRKTADRGEVFLGGQCDPQSALKANSPNDINVFCNLVDLYNDLLTTHHCEHMERWLPELSRAIISHSIKFPLISGFYKLLSAVLQAADTIDYFKHSPSNKEDKKQIVQLVNRFIVDLLIQLHQYKGDLQMSCLQVILSAPVQLVQSIIHLQGTDMFGLDQLSKALQVVFQVGYSYLAIAHRGMDALERWQSQLSPDVVKPLFNRILPYFDSFLQSTGNIGSTVDNSDAPAVPKSQRLKQKLEIVDTELSRLQNRILGLLSRLDTLTCSSLLHKEKTAVKWCSDDILLLDIPFADIRPMTYIDSLAPRIMELALASSDRRTRCLACDVFHSLITIYLGNSRQWEATKQKPIRSFLKKVMPSLLQLGCDSDSYVQQLFRPLVMQIAHYFSSKMMLKSSHKNVFIETVFDGLTHKTDTAVRDFSALCLKEFIKWSIKQLSVEEIKNCPFNIQNIVKRINAYCLHPSIYKRLGAALAFNNLYVEMREEASIVDVFWLNILYHFVQSLALYDYKDSHQVVFALDHVKRVIVERSNVFNQTSPNRQTPPGLRGCLLKDIVEWLLLLCSSKHTDCRHACMNLVSDLAPYVEGCTHMKDFINGEQIVKICEGGGNSSELLVQPDLGNMASLLSWLQHLIAALDCYTWLIKKDISLAILPTNSSILSSLRYFMSEISLSPASVVLQKLQGTSQGEDDLSISDENVFAVSKCSVIIHLFEFVVAVDKTGIKLKTLWDPLFWSFVGWCILKPSEVGFDWSNQPLVNRLCDIVLPLLATLRNQLSEQQFKEFSAILESLLEIDCSTILSELKQILTIGGNVTTRTTEFIQGITALHKCGYFTSLMKMKGWISEDIVRAVFTAVTDLNGGCAVLEPPKLVYADSLLKLAHELGLKMSRFVTIDFNSLDVIANVESWVVVLDFFGISSTELDVQSHDSTNEPVTKTQQASQVEQTHVNSEFEITVRSLSLVLNRKDYEVARANMSQLNAHITTIGGSGVTDTEASVGSLSLSDLTPVHSQLYREKFITAGLNVVMKKYNTVDFNRSREVDVSLKTEMTSVLYVHTQRFVAELQAFFRHFSQLQKLLGSIRSARKMSDFDGPSMRIKLELLAASPVILLPLSSRSSEVLIADLGRLCVSNRFLMSGSEGTISFVEDSSKEVLLEVMNIQLDNMDLLTGERCTDITENCISLGSYCVQRRLESLLREKCQLQLKIERNLMTHISHNVVPDMSVMGTLSTLAATINLAQYQLIRGLLTYNIGEYLDDIHLEDNSSSQSNLHQDEDEHVNVWISMSISLELVDVSVCLKPNPDLTLTCINFVKSHLVVESFSDHTQDIDLVSQEILITDTRFINKPANKRSNVFTNILQPIFMSSEGTIVQAQVHHRRLLDLSKFTILLNNMRLMAILDWWEAVRDFIMESPDNPVPEAVARDVTKQISTPVQIPFEMKLNITDSEIVFVEDTSQWDTNAVILKSTTVITYRPLFSEKPVSCNLNHCEMFSCILGMEDETALSIIDPVTVNIEIVKVSSATEDFKILKVQMVRLSLRLSYYDVRMFSQMLKSLPKQTQWARSHSVEAEYMKPANFRITEQMKTLSALGFQLEDCNEALRQCNGQLDDAALWLTQNATPSSVVTHGSGAEAERAFSRLEVATDCLSVCVIDDCRDADVPLIELTMANLTLKQDVVEGNGTANCYLSSDYYNRLLSGWEPFLEPWTCQIQWEHSFRASRLQMFLTSKDALNINITSTLVELYSSVKENWTQDYYNPKDKNDAVASNKTLGSPPGYRRRSPFVPFALKNDTGSRLWFTTITTANDGFAESSFNKSPSPSETSEHWVPVDSGDTVPFSFEERDKMRHRDTHKLQTHKLSIRVEGWHKIDPVSVDRVGIYFRLASPDYNSGSLDLPQARIVLEVTLEGSARKLVTVRSALQLNNQLVDTVEVKLDNTHIYNGGHPTHLIIGPGATLSVPMSYALAQIWVRPLDRSQMLTHYHAFCNRPIAWQHVTRPGQAAEELRQCHSNRGVNYRFTAAIRRENYPYDRPPPLAPPLHNMWLQPAHTITLLSALTIVNLLPHELAYSIKDITKGRIKPGQQAAIHEVSQESSVELSLHLENYPGSGGITIPSFTSSFTARLRVHDHNNRKLYLQAAVIAQQGSGLRVLVSAPFWLVNKTALPLVFRQEGVATETAGQFEEHEVARMVAPLLFSFADQDASPTVVARVGNKVHPDGMPQWCQHFSLVPGVKVRRLRISLRENRPDVVYMMGIDIRPGRGRYRATNIVTLSAHYQIHNKSSYRIQFAQRCFASTVSDPGAQATYLQAVPDCSLAFHWPRLDKDQLLCLRLMDVPQCQWSGGFLINNNDSFHVNVRDLTSHMYFLRVEIVLQRATYFIVITDADSMPAPIRIDNFSQVAVQFYQTNVQVISTVRAHSSVPYALDEPNNAQCITLVAPGGVCAIYDINKLGEGPGLTYENFIYIAFTATFRREGDSGDADDPLDVQSQQLVLDVPDSSGRVVLSRKQFGARSQLWRMTSEGQLQHEGSSPPKASQDKILVLDISTPAPQPSQYVSLILRRPDKRRTSTQTWRFTEDGRLCCVHNNMCVQAKDGFFGLRRGSPSTGVPWQKWSEAVLGPPQPVCYQATEQGIPFEQAVSRQRLRPGSGFLAVRVLTDGPTRVLQISDVRDSRMVAVLEENDWVHIAVNQRPKLLTDDSALVSPKECKEFQLTVELPCIGISMVSRQPPEELLYIKLGEFQLSAMWTPEAEMLDAFVRDIQIDNQLFEAQCPVLLYVTPISRSTDPEEAARPAIQITAERVPRPKNSNAEIVKHLIVKVKNMSLNIEERLMLKLFAYVGYGIKEEQEDVDESDFETQRILAEATSVHAKRYYFGSLKLIFWQVRLSVMTSNKLGENLLAIKRKLGLTLIKFEDAAVELEPFCKQHVFENSQFLFSSILKHYKDELKWQAASILGSVDFLGNPLGFVNDLSEGMSGLIYEGNVGALVKNVTHGISNSAAKVTESLSDGLGRVILDDEHEEIRRRIRGTHAGTSGDHLVAGLKGLGFGLLGGVTSVFKQTYEGASNEGFPGFISGLGKGIVGTVTKPVVGVLDLASETASAVRDSSRGSNRQAPSRSRLPRCVTSPSGLLPTYSRKQSQGQEFLYRINTRRYSELFMAYEILRGGIDDLRIVISSEMVRVFTCASNNTCTPVIETHLSDLLSCQPVSLHDMGSTLHYIELTMRVDIASRLVGQDPVKRPRVRCDSRPIANWVSQQVNHARAMYIEHQHTLQTTSDSLED